MEGIRIIGLLIVLTFFLGFGLLTVVGNSFTALADTLLQRRGIAGVIRTVLSLGIILSGFDFLLPDFLNRAIVGDSMAGQALEMLKGLCLTI